MHANLSNYDKTYRRFADEEDAIGDLVGKAEAQQAEALAGDGTYAWTLNGQLRRQSLIAETLDWLADHEKEALKVLRGKLSMTEVLALMAQEQGEAEYAEQRPADYDDRGGSHE